MTPAADAIPVIDQIARKVAARVETVNQGNGYLFNVKEVVRPKRRNDYTPADGVAVVQIAGFEQGEPETDSQGLLTWRTVNFTIDVFIEPSDHDDRPFDELCAFAITEIERAFTVDFYPTGGLGPFAGAAANAFVNAPQVILDKESAGVRINLAVRYRHADTDPYTPV